MDGKKQRGGRVRELYDLVRTELLKRRGERGALLTDALVFMLAFFFARTHVAFGAYPLGIALVAVINKRTALGALGAFVGALSLGEIGIIYALIIPLILLMRLILSSNDEGPLFSEGYIIRVLSAALASTLVGIYELAAVGFTLSAVLYAASSVLLAVGVALSLFGVFTAKIPVEVVLGRKALSLADEEGRASVWLFRGSLLMLLFLIGVSLGEYVFFGINLSYVFSAAVTVLVAARFGTPYAIAVGFMSGLATSAVGGAAFALVGAAVGFLYPVGYAYSLVGGAVVLSVFSGYADGLVGFLSLFPEYGVSAILMLPYLKGSVRGEDLPSAKGDVSSTSSVSELMRDAVERTREERRGLDDVMTELSRLDPPLGAECEFSEYRDIIIALTSGLDPTPCDENIDALAAKLYKRSRIGEDDVARLIGEEARPLYSVLMHRVGEYERERYKRRGGGAPYEYAHLARLIRADKMRLRQETSEDESLGASLRDELSSFGLLSLEVKVLGSKRKRVLIGAKGAESQLSSADLHRKVMEVLGARLECFEYFKRGDASLLSAYTAPRLRCEYATVGAPSERTGKSGDSHISFTADGAFISVISDGEGSGAYASSLSTFVTGYLSSSLTPDKTSARESLGAIDAILSGRGEERFATADVLTLDLYSGELRVLKAGAAPSFIVRGGSVFAVRAQGAPLGSGGGAEETVSEVDDGCTVFMISDGVAAVPEESVWLLSEMARRDKLSAGDKAERILTLAAEHNGRRDDMTVTVIKVYSNE